MEVPHSSFLAQVPFWASRWLPLEKLQCFGRGKYKAYLKALISTGIVPPKKSVSFSVGSYREKLELLPFGAKVECRWLEEHGVPCEVRSYVFDVDFLRDVNWCPKYLATLVDGSRDKQALEYSPTQHLANNPIDMYRLRITTVGRPASRPHEQRLFPSDGHLTLLSCSSKNVKNATNGCGKP